MVSLLQLHLEVKEPRDGRELRRILQQRRTARLRCAHGHCSSAASRRLNARPSDKACLPAAWHNCKRLCSDGKRAAYRATQRLWEVRIEISAGRGR